jgi:hypothetical protein
MAVETEHKKLEDEHAVDVKTAVQSGIKAEGKKL